MLHSLPSTGHCGHGHTPIVHEFAKGPALLPPRTYSSTADFGRRERRCLGLGRVPDGDFCHVAATKRYFKRRRCTAKWTIDGLPEPYACLAQRGRVGRPAEDLRATDVSARPRAAFGSTLDDLPVGGRSSPAQSVPSSVVISRARSAHPPQVSVSPQIRVRGLRSPTCAWPSALAASSRMPATAAPPLAGSVTSTPLHRLRRVAPQTGMRPPSRCTERQNDGHVPTRSSGRAITTTAP